MLIAYLSAYLIFIIAVSVIISLLVLALKLPAPRILIPSIMAIILLPAVLGYLYVTYFTSIPELNVPDVRGMQLAEAEVRLGALKLKSRYMGSVYDTAYPEGSVVSQRPEAGRRVKAGRIINLITSSGKGRVEVPNLLGRPLQQAEAVLLAKGLLLGQMKEDFVPELDAGMVLIQTPLPGEEVDTGTVVEVTVSTSREPTSEGVGEEKPKEREGFWPWW